MSDFDALLGEWTVEASIAPGATGRAVCERLEGEAFVVLRSYAPDPAPDSVWVIGGDDSSREGTALYHDTRGVSRVYGTSLVDGVWRLWRDAPGFAQRFTGTLAADGRTIRGAWELSTDNATWQHDFDLTYTRMG